MARGRGGSTRGRGRRDVPSSPARLPHMELPITYIEGGVDVGSSGLGLYDKDIQEEYPRKRNMLEASAGVPQAAVLREVQEEYYRWDKAIDKLVEVAFMKKAKKRYGDMSWMSEVAGPGTGCSRHTGGSRTTIEHSHVLREELNHDPNPYECFLHTHKKKDGSFVDERSRLIADIDARVAAATQRAEERDEPLEIDMTQMYLDAVGGVEKDRVYGIGSLANIFYTTALKVSRAASTQFDEAAFRRQVAEEMQRHFNEQMEERDARVRRQLQEEMAEMEARMTHIIEDLRRQGHLPPA
ncbi:hypothetical protein CASFOL_010145 [Castilleja foliolosa]|uniref:Uncharacterized protein n=1 Tax=Castilleja foliolosa TaxID=1961234 RepID=A0ABD3DVR5_9LAMI